MAPSDEELLIEDQPYVVADSPIALSPGYVADSDPEEDSEDGPVDYPADGGDGDDDDSFDNDEEEEASGEEDEEHLAPADSVVAPVVDHVPSTELFETNESAATPPSPPAYHTTARIFIRPEAPMPFPSEEEVERLLALPPPPPSPFISLLPPSAGERLARCLAAPALPSSPLPIVPHAYGSPKHVRAPPGFRAAMGRLRASSPSTTSVITITTSTIITTFTTTYTHIIAITIITTTTTTSLTIYTTTSRPLGGHSRGQVTTSVKEFGYGIRDVWVDPTKAVEEVAPTTLEGVNARVTKLAAVQELSSVVHYELQTYMTHTQIQDFRIASQESLMTTLIAHVSSLQGQLSAALGQIQALQARGETHADNREGAASTANNMPPRRSSATARAVATAVADATSMTVAAVEQLIKARVSAALANHETLRNS
ncbi:hypothetical protein Tco_0116043, partial [Tanacetum coccineum]